MDSHTYREVAEVADTIDYYTMARLTLAWVINKCHVMNIGKPVCPTVPETNHLAWC